MKKITRKYKQHLLKKSRKALKKSKRNKYFRKQKYSDNSYLTYLNSLRLREQKDKRSSNSKIIEKKPSDEFTIQKHPRNVINFIWSLKQYAKKYFSGYQIIIELSSIKQIDMGAICLLLSTIQELAYYRVNVTGNIPQKGECRTMFIQSGFLSHVKTMTGQSIQPVKSRISILKRGKDRTSNREVGETIKQAIEMISGKREHYPPIYSIVQEINGNSVEHAYENTKKEHWMFAINYDETTKKVIFAFADNGLGILQTLRRKFSQHFFDSLQLSSNDDILTGAFNKKYSSRHEDQINRNKGLPLLKKIQSQKEVGNLLVITNNVYLCIDSYESIILQRPFNGTFYYWELDQDTIAKWKNRIKSHQ